jgi:hypothetical protein
MSVKTQLPIVSVDTYNTLMDTLHHRFKTNIDFIQDYEKHLIKVNPVLHEFITRWVRDANENEWPNIAFGMMLVYKILENQVEVDDLNNNYGETDAKGQEAV